MEDLVTVFRSADTSAQEDAGKVIAMLGSQGIVAVLVTDEAAGVPEGACEVRVAAGDALRAETLISANPIDDEFSNPDESSELDLETVFQTAGTDESEALAVKGMLESNGIFAELVGDSRLPNLPVEVRVPHERVEEAKALIAAAQVSGSAAADEAEAASESEIL